MQLDPVKLPKVIGENPTFSEFIAVVNKTARRSSRAHFSSANVGNSKQAAKLAAHFLSGTEQIPADRRLLVHGTFPRLREERNDLLVLEKQENEKIVYVCDPTNSRAAWRLLPRLACASVSLR